ncbi:hypothetical protein ACFYZB_21515 [Streptomyces sp. NPDC001852]|uniref:hypothetical protein n=1 Tax=Streptomyces sp. NPDC001852 TaxID=3364619 RepID=UPI0036B70D8B
MPVQHYAGGHCCLVGVAPTGGRSAGIRACVVALIAGLCGASAGGIGWPAMP